MPVAAAALSPRGAPRAPAAPPRSGAAPPPYWTPTPARYTRKPCGLRVGGKYGNTTCGALFAVCCGCGLLLPPIELPDSESTRFVLYYLTLLFKGRSYGQPGRGYFAVIFDDMCHLLRYAIKRKDLHPDIARFVEEPLHAVDRFHFSHNHTGAWCAANVDPDRLPELLGCNTSAAEQAFVSVGRHSLALRHMNEPRFRRMLLEIVWADHAFRRLGLMAPVRTLRPAPRDLSLLAQRAALAALASDSAAQAAQAGPSAPAGT
jgi:hypothetical protein